MTNVGAIRGAFLMEDFSYEGWVCQAPAEAEIRPLLLNADCTTSTGRERRGRTSMDFECDDMKRVIPAARSALGEGGGRRFCVARQSGAGMVWQ